MEGSPKTVCFFGIYDPSYARPRVLKAGFEKNGYRVVECRADPKKHRGLGKFFELYREFRTVRSERFDQVLVCFPGHSIVFLARLLFGRRIMFDAFVSLYDSAVCDRRVYSPRSVGALYSWFLDWSSCRLASRILLDTNAHIRYFAEMFDVPKERCIRVPVGADDTVFFPRPDVPDKKIFTVHFHGTFIPLQGIEYIVEAARVLLDEDIRFRILGSGQIFADIKRRADLLGLSNVEFAGKVPIGDVADSMASAHVALGIFGMTEKTGRVVPNKVYEGMAMGKAIITADTPAVRELPGAASALRLIPTGDAHALADAVLDLKRDHDERRRLGAAALALFRMHCTPEKIVADLLHAL